MIHLLLIDPLEKLNTKKDSSLMLGLSLKQKGEKVFFLFEKDFYVQNSKQASFKVWDFEGSFKEKSFYLESFKLTLSQELLIDSKVMIHMRLDPPFDSHYLRVLWMLDHYQAQGVSVVNQPRGIMQFNEKLYAYRLKEAPKSFVGENKEAARLFIQDLKTDELILKPLDLFGGLGVEKVSVNDWETAFERKVKELKGPVILQPYLKEVEAGEFRAIYFKGQNLGTILKTPQKGAFLSNIAQGASYKKAQLSPKAQLRCEEVAKELKDFGVDWIAFDVLGEMISEVNITCPGLLVEVSEAMGENLALKMF